MNVSFQYGQKLDIVLKGFCRNYLGYKLDIVLKGVWELFGL